MLARTARMTAVIVAVCVLIVAGTFPSLAQRRDAVRLLYSDDIYSLTSVVALEKGFFSEEGLAVNALPLPYGALGITALAGGTADFAVSANARFMGAVLSDLPIVTIGITAYGYQGELIVPLSDTETTSLEDLRGKRIGMQMGSGASAVFLRYLDALGYTMDDFEFVEIGTAQIPSALATGALDAGLLWRPYSTQAIQQGLARAVLGPEEQAEAVASTYAFPVMTSEAVIRNRPDVVQRFANAWVKAMNFIDQNPEEAVGILRDAIANQTGFFLPWEVVEEYLSAARFDRATFSDEDILDTLASADIFVKFGIRDETATFDALKARVDNSFMENAEETILNR